MSMRTRHIKVISLIIKNKGNCASIIGEVCHVCPLHYKCDGCNYEGFVHEIRLHDAMTYLKDMFTPEEAFEALL